MSDFAIMENLSYFASMVTAGAVVYTAWRGGVALSNWQNEKRFNKKFECALHIMDLTYRARYEIDNARLPFRTPIELVKAEENLKKWIKPKPNAEEQKRAIEAQLMIDRLKKSEEIEKEIVDCLSTAHILFGDEVEEALKNLRMSFIILSSSAYVIILENHDDSNTLNFDIFVKSLFVDRKKETDIFERNVQSYIKKIRRACQPVIGTMTDRKDASKGIKKTLSSFLKRIF